ALDVRNSGSRPVLMLEGELLEGGWQSRALVRDLILAPRSSHRVDVSCVEQHRWGGEVSHERRARRASPRVQMALRGDDLFRQERVWDGVRRYDETTGPTATSSLADHIDRLDALAPLVPVAGQRGVLVGVGGQPLALELFGSAPALAAHLASIIEAARLDALLVDTPTTTMPGRRARRMTARLSTTRLEQGREFVGDGVSIGASTPGMVVRGVTTQSGGLAHLSVLNTQHPVMA
ncbi:MAG: hypothetical protein M3Y06_09605, partial [Actinomycetota bacterium]|nr:hypothetical protein [Actinomycetota bacterium]